MLPSQKRNANATEKLDFGYKDSEEALQKKLDLSALCLMCSCVAVMLHCTAARGPPAAPHAGLCALALSAAAGDGAPRLLRFWGWWGKTGCELAGCGGTQMWLWSPAGRSSWTGSAAPELVEEDCCGSTCWVCFPMGGVQRGLSDPVGCKPDLLVTFP